MVTYFAKIEKNDLSQLTFWHPAGFGNYWKKTPKHM